MTHEIILSGFGGQGVMLMGQLLTQAGLEEDKQVSWIPSYGPEMRGGTAFCSVIISNDIIGSPLISYPTLLVPMNLPSMRRFEPQLVKGGTMVLNSSLINEEPSRTDIAVFKIPMNDLATEMNNIQVLNIIGLGAIVAASEVVSQEAALKAIDKTFGEKFISKPHLLELNRQAFAKGIAAVKK
ncbi:MAG: 2-oxoacid:acceptor oxidoreductase family protein [Desulfarculales bacterium]|jgi:2-oxoglutarate ferredoxin oxidoreductase subunit gamma|nr:2-oxoacid:acceptor oxidoreductase family protein [Desulfarculales bacterium]